MVPVSCCGARCAPCRRRGCVAFAARLGCPISSLPTMRLRQLSTPAHTYAPLYLPPAARSNVAAATRSPPLTPPPAAVGSLPGLSPSVRVRPVQKINPIVNVSFTMGFIGAGDRTRTGTLFTARDFKSLVSTYSTTPAGVEIIIAHFGCPVKGIWWEFL